MILRLIRTRVVCVAAVFTALVCVTATSALAQQSGGTLDAILGGETEEERAAAEVEAAERAAAARRETLNTIGNILSAIDEREREAARLRWRIERMDTDADREAANAELTALNTEIAELRAQIEALATGVSAEDLDASLNETFNLQAELETLVQPFVLMMKSATENARAIETLRRTVLLANRSASAAEAALTQISGLLENDASGATGEALQSLAERWRQRLEAARDRGAAAQRQLEARLAAQEDPGDTAAQAFQSFFSERGRNFAFGVSAFFGVFFGLRLVRRGALAVLGAPRNRSVPARLAAFVFDVLTVLAAFGAMLAVFNYYNDWLLTGVTVLVLIALGWFVLRSAPVLFEQITLLLNLGAVQENERVLIDGVPWRVARLDVYSELENPALRGGSFTVPIRELRGLHSRPMDESETWFPSVEGDFVELENGVWGQVLFQSPELVQISEEGGAVSTYTLQSYLAQNPRNLSQGYRATTVLALAHDQLGPATTAAAQQMAASARVALGETLPAEAVRRVEAEFVRAGPAGLEIEVSADLTGAAADRRDAATAALALAAARAADQNGWRLAAPVVAA